MNAPSPEAMRVAKQAAVSCEHITTGPYSICLACVARALDAYAALAVEATRSGLR